MKLILVLFAVLVSFALAHISAIGSNGPRPNQDAFFKADAKSPCPAPSVDVDRYNVSIGQAFVVQWALLPNHNVPPQPNGIASFLWIQGVPKVGSKGVPVSSPVTIAQQESTYYFTTNVAVLPGDSAGRATLQVVYDVNGADSPFPVYYQCLDFFVGGTK